MSTVMLLPVDRDNWEQTLRLSVHPEQMHFVADFAPISALALAKAYVGAHGRVWLPLVFAMDGWLVGFTAVAHMPSAPEAVWIFHFFIDAAEQGKGYGKQALSALLPWIERHYPDCRSVMLTVNTQNKVAQALYRQAGFEPTGDIQFGEYIYRLVLRRES